MTALVIPRLEDVLESAGARRLASGRWRIVVGEHPVSVRLEPGWLVLEERMEEPDLPTLWKVLEVQGRTGGRIAFALEGVSHRLLRRAEHSLEEPSETAVWLSDRLASWPGSEAEALDQIVSEERDAAHLERIEGLCREAGWLVDRIDTERIVRWRSASAAHGEASLRAAGNDLVVCCELARLDSISVEARAAISVFLTSAAQTLRGVTTAILGESENAVAGLTAWLPRMASRAAIDTALSACAFARDRCRAEVEALREDSIARQFLEVTSWHGSLSSISTGGPHDGHHASGT